MIVSHGNNENRRKCRRSIGYQNGIALLTLPFESTGADQSWFAFSLLQQHTKRAAGHATIATRIMATNPRVGPIILQWPSKSEDPSRTIIEPPYKDFGLCRIGSKVAQKMTSLTCGGGSFLRCDQARCEIFEERELGE